jgi:transcriptional regulator with XRE-family HTH domain
VSEQQSATKPRLSKEERTFGKEMQRLRKGAGLSQSEMADVLAAAGISPMNQVIVSRIENGVRPVTMREAQFISAYFHRTTWSMMSPEGANALPEIAAVTVKLGETAILGLETAVLRLLNEQARAKGLLGKIDAVDWDQEHPDSKLDISTYVPKLAELIKVDVRQVVERALEKQHGEHPTAP